MIFHQRRIHRSKEEPSAFKRCTLSFRYINYQVTMQSKSNNLQAKFPYPIVGNLRITSINKGRWLKTPGILSASF